MSNSMMKMLKAVLFTPMHDSEGGRFTGRWGVPIMFVGAPGGAKTSSSRSLVNSFSMWCEILSPGERGEGAFGVVPVPGEGNAFLQYPPPDWTLQAVKLNEDGNIDPAGEAGVVIVDELNTAGPNIQPALLGLINDGRIGGQQLPPRVRRMGIMNDMQDAAGGWELARSLKNRFVWVNWSDPTVTNYTAFLLGGLSSIQQFTATDAATEEARVLSEWPTAWAEVTGMVTTFLNRHPKMMRTTEVEGEHAYATSRTIMFAMHLMATAKVHGLDAEMTATLVKGAVGSTWWETYRLWRKEINVPNALDVLDGKVPFKHDTLKLDLSYVLFNTAVEHLTKEEDKETKKRRGARLWALLKEAMDAGDPDVAMPAALALSANAISLTCKEALSVCAKLDDFKQKLAKA